jgi:hypothetical protein
MTEIKYDVVVKKAGTLWLLNDKYHREDGPAVEWGNGTKIWYLNGERHRVDGPAYEGADGSKSWYLNDKDYTEAAHKKEIARRNKPSCEGKVVEIDGKKYALKAVK